ncbi:hypothetical protein NK718_14640 [Alsobacter sp. SYSU M60028]|uniref:Divergent polysaccharide deacetylase family protein n=1 Tax=Alsobacter ponti TaxID=2962936 RepID=A0ABT1LF63_9HYPH|nr:hypothetical protein [Alsobacter ponti]MCP8939763.1 hypothetical protein [Alsobacter ponti]
MISAEQSLPKLSVADIPAVRLAPARPGPEPIADGGPDEPQTGRDRAIKAVLVGASTGLVALAGVLAARLF